MSGNLIEDRIKQVFELIAEAAKKSGRSLQDITVLGATKKQPIEHLRKYVHAGFNHFGESYVQEALEKQKALSEFNVDWHFIGSLQSKKCKQVIGRFHLIHSVDRKNLITELAKRCQAQQCQQQILLQVNIGGENSKSGCDPKELPGLIEFVQKQEGLILAGLMTMPPQTDRDELACFHS